MSLFESLSRISEQIKLHREVMNSSEVTTEQVSVQPFINALGYDSNNPSEVRKQFSILNWDAVDFAVLSGGKPKIVIEAKRAGDNLGTKHWKQLFEYFNADHARVGILTNGIEYRFFTDLKKGNIMDDQPFLELNMLDLDKRLVAALKNFTKSHFDINEILAYAQRQRIKQLLEQEMENPSDAMVDHFARTLHHGRVSSTDRQHYRDLLREAWRDLKKLDVVPDPPTIAIDDVRVELEEDGFYKVVVIPVVASYEEARFEAVFFHKTRTDGKTHWFNIGINMVFQGEKVNQAAAALRAVQSVEPQRKSVTGLKFWHFKHPTNGERVPLTILYDEPDLVTQLH